MLKCVCVQGMAEYLMQGQHFAACQGKGHLADTEVLELKDQYGDAQKRQSVESLLKKVYTRSAARFSSYLLSMLLSEAVCSEILTFVPSQVVH